MPDQDEFDHRLNGFRAQIDALDDELIALIKRRSDVVARVGELKRAHLDTRCFIRPAREATMVRRIASEFANHPFSAGAVASIWRLIISASTSIEQTLRVAAYATPTSTDAYWLAREYFGAFSAITKESVPSRIIGQVMDGSALVGVLPALDAGSEETWWKLLPRGENVPRPTIFACLPYAVSEPTPRPLAIAVGYVDCEPTGEDVTYLVIESRHDLSQSRIHSHFAASPLTAKWLQVMQEPSTDSRLHLIELEGFVRNDDPTLLSLQEQCRDQLVGLAILGSHAKPISLSN